MPDVTVKSIDDMDAIYGGLARRARAELGVTAWGMQVFTLPPDWDGYPNHNHCYRMLGSLHDADDAVQETMLRAWKGSERYEPRAQLGTWLHAIATNVCLSAISRRRARPAEVTEDLEYLQPYPDRLLEDLVARETVELAFITAIQLLPPKQRAVLILREVLDWSAKEAADALEDSVAAVNSALQRARAGLEQSRRRAPMPAERERALVKRFMAAWDAVDIDGLVALL